MKNLVKLLFLFLFASTMSFGQTVVQPQNGGTGANTLPSALTNIWNPMGTVCATGTLQSCINTSDGPVLSLSGATGSFIQYNYGIATAQCVVDQTTGLLNITPKYIGYGYTSAPTVTITNSHSAIATVSATANVVGGSVTSYNVTSSSTWNNIGSASLNCPVTISVAAPPTPATSQTIIKSTGGVTAFQPFIRVDDFGCAGDGTTDDTTCFNNAMQYAVTTKSKAVALTQGKSYYLGSFTGTYQAGGDNGAVPIAATLSCTASSGIVSGCSITSGGSGMLSTAGSIKTNASGSGSGATFTSTLVACDITHCPSNTNGYYVSAITASGGTGYPNSFTEYIGPTCAGIPCTNLAPNYSQVGYSINVPQNITIIGNGATVTSGFNNTAKTTYPYLTESSNPGASFPYGTSFLMSSGVTVRDLTITNTFIGFSYSSYDTFDNITVSNNGMIFQAQNAQFATFHRINSRGNYGFGGWYLGGQQVDRSPFNGQNYYAATNSYNLADDIIVNDVMLYGPYGVQTTTTAFNNQRKALDCWFDQQFAHIEDTGWTTSDACYTPVGYTTLGGTTARMPDQDIATLPAPDFQFRTLYGTAVTMLTMYARPFIDGSFRNVIVKQNPDYAMNLTSMQNGVIENVPTESAGYCVSGTRFGSASCPNPYESQNTTVPSAILAGGFSFNSVKFENILQSNGVECAVTQPWTSGISWSNSNFTSMVVKQSSQCVGGTSAIYGYGTLTNEYAPSAGSVQGSQYNSLFSTWVGNNYIYGIAARQDIWRVAAKDGLLYQTVTNTRTSNPSYLEFESSTNQSLQLANYAAVKVPSLVVESSAIGGGQVTSITLNTAGSGYTPYSHIGCYITPSPQELPGTTITGTNQTGTWTLGSNWTGSSPSSGFTHTAGATATAYDSYAPTIGHFYVVTFSISSSTVGTFTVSMGGVSSKVFGGNGTSTLSSSFRVIATSTAVLTITPDTTFAGTISSISIVDLGVASSTFLYNATCDAQANAAGGVADVNVIWPALGYTSAPTVTFDSTTGTTPTATAVVNTIDNYNGVGHQITDWTYLAAGGTVPAFGSVTITNVSCPSAYYSSTSSTIDNVRILQPSFTGVTITGKVTASGVCSLNLANSTNASVNYTQGPWHLLFMGSKGVPPNSSFAQTTATTDSTSLAPGATVNGGTGINTSASTGVAQVASGIWSVSNALPSTTTATTQSTSDSSTSVATDAFVKNVLASPPAIGSSTPAAATVTTLTANTSISSSGSVSAATGVTISATTAANYATNNTTASTSSTCVVGGSYNIGGTYWNGSTSASETISLTPSCSGTTNPSETVTLSATGSTGIFNLVVSGLSKTKGFGNSTGATLAAGAAAGSSPTIACTTSHVCSATSGTITLTVGTSPTTGALLTITDPVTKTNYPDCIAHIILTASPYTELSNYSFSYTTAVNTLNVGTALTASTSYTITYHCFGY